MILLLFFLLFIIAVLVYMRLPKFGKTPAGNYAAGLMKSPNFYNGSFQNASETPNLTEGIGVAQVMREVWFKKRVRAKPARPLPSQKTNLLALQPDENVLVWFGHSSYFMQIDGKTILVDPVLSGAASPLRFMIQSFAGSDIYTVADLPAIDYLFISHDHWDHLDYQTIVALKSNVRHVICGLGVSAHLLHWGYDAAIITERDWHETIPLDDGFTVHTVPARHFSGRSVVRNQVLWTAFVLQTPSLRIFMGGDSGYDTHFAATGAAYGPFDLVILECGQYNKLWKYIHALPEEVAQAAHDLRAKRLLPVHWAKFALSTHPWDEPILRIAAASKAVGMPMAHPLIGEKLDLNDPGQVFKNWWEGID